MPRAGLIVLLVLFAGCRLTDHSERDANEVSTELLNFPASGYQDVDPEDLPQLTFDNPHADMGRVIQGARVDEVYTFTNTGGSPLVISDVRSTCGCTVGKDWPKDPIAPGEVGTISVSFDSEGRSGRQEKTVTVVANTTPPSTILTLTGEVVGPAGTSAE